MPFIKKYSKVIKVHITDDYYRIRVRNPEDFIPSSFRTQDIGHAGSNKRIAGILKFPRKWATQAWLIAKENAEIRGNTLHPCNERTRRILNSIRSNNGLIRVER